MCIGASRPRENILRDSRSYCVIRIRATGMQAEITDGSAIVSVVTFAIDFVVGRNIYDPFKSILRIIYVLPLCNYVHGHSYILFRKIMLLYKLTHNMLYCFRFFSQDNSYIINVFSDSSKYNNIL